jgi:hypothetical protein
MVASQTILETDAKPPGLRPCNFAVRFYCGSSDDGFADFAEVLLWRLKEARDLASDLVCAED